jgi:hypothetical protein
MGLRIQHVVTSGIFSLDGEDFDVDNNIWLIGDDHEVVVVDAAHDHRPIVEAVGGRRTLGVLCTHGHNDHINAAVELADSVDAPIWLHPDDGMLWDVVHPDRRIDDPLRDGMAVTVASHEGEPISIDLPDTVVMEVTEADAVVKGQTASSSYKPAMLENGVRVLVPPHIEAGTRIVVRPEDSTYVERAKD